MGKPGRRSLHLFQNVKTQLRLLAGLELVGAVAGADGDGQGVHTGAGNEILHLFRDGCSSSLSASDLYIVFHAGQGAQLALNHDTVVVGIFHYLAGHSDILLIRLGWSRRS